MRVIAASFMWRQYFVVITDDGNIYRGVPEFSFPSPASITWEYVGSLG